MVSRYLLFSMAMLVLVFLYLAWSVDSSWAPYAIVPAVLGAVVLVLSPQIDWWGYRRNPPPVPAPFLQLLRKKSSFLNTLSPEGRKRYLQRMVLYTKAHSFTGKSIKTVPEDVKLVLSSYANMLTLNKEDFLLKPFERIVFYPHPFPSPEIPQLHTSEMHVKDGVLIFSVPHIMRAFSNPKANFQPVLYEYGRVCKYLWTLAPWPDTGSWNVEMLEAISGFSMEQVQKVVGTPEVDPDGVLIHHFFQFPARFNEQQPELYSRLSVCFELDPLDPRISST